MSGLKALFDRWAALEADQRVGACNRAERLSRESVHEALYDLSNYEIPSGNKTFTTEGNHGGSVLSESRDRECGIRVRSSCQQKRMTKQTCSLITVEEVCL